MSDFPAVILTLTPRVRSSSIDEIVINLRHRTIERGFRSQGFNAGSKQFTLAAGLIASRGRLVSLNELVDLLYGDLDDGGPECARLCVYAMIGRLRPTLMPIGIDIENQFGQGFRCENRLALWQRRAA